MFVSFFRNIRTQYKDIFIISLHEITLAGYLLKCPHTMLHIAQGTLVAFILLTILFYLRTERSYLYLVLNVLPYTVVVN